jgi:hypothetical protein
VVEAVKKEFGINIPVSRLNHTTQRRRAARAGEKWVDMFNETRDRFQNEIADIPIANKAYRLRVLQRMSVTQRT